VLRAQPEQRRCCKGRQTHRRRTSSEAYTKCFAAKPLSDSLDLKEHMGQWMKEAVLDLIGGGGRPKCRAAPDCQSGMARRSRMSAHLPKVGWDEPRKPSGNCHSARKAAFGLRSTF
jgi:hypothetical protein